jgi:NAD(P)-dependent dehydrogenase (short-subunit alcohol dehydrogenase family)
MTTSGRWTVDSIPDLSDKVAVVTGANSGLGFETTRGLVSKGAQVVLACRNLEKGNSAREAIRAEFPEASLEVMELDLANLDVIHGFADAFAQRYLSLDILCNNAGVMALPYRQTADGFEMQFGTNHLGHFALTGLLMAQIRNAATARIITVSSEAHRFGKIDLDRLQGENGYRKWMAYAQSKLANVLFAYELQRRLEACDVNAVSVVADPGYAATNLQYAGPRMEGSALWTWVMRIGNRLVAQSAQDGALPILYAATVPALKGGDYIGPDGLFGLRGHPERTRSSRASHDRETAARLWAVSEDLTGVKYLNC